MIIQLDALERHADPVIANSYNTTSKAYNVQVTNALAKTHDSSASGGGSTSG